MKLYQILEPLPYPDNKGKSYSALSVFLTNKEDALIFYESIKDRYPNSIIVSMDVIVHSFKSEDE